MPELAYVNGEFLPLERAVVPVEDRGYQFADAVYEVLRVYAGRVFALEEHLGRLARSLAGIRLQPGLTGAELQRLIAEAVRRSEFADATVYLQISRGVAKRHRGVAPGLTPMLVITVRPLAPPPATVRGPGVKLLTVPDDRWAHCDIKSVGLLANVLAYERAREAGADDALFVDATGAVAESTAGNLFVVSGTRLRTPPNGPRLLAGVTRDKILGLASELGLQAETGPLRQADLTTAEEAFLTSTTAQVTPVAAVDGMRIGTETPGPVTARVYQAFLALVKRGGR